MEAILLCDNIFCKIYSGNKVCIVAPKTTPIIIYKPTNSRLSSTQTIYFLKLNTGVGFCLNCNEELDFCVFTIQRLGIKERMVPVNIPKMNMTETRIKANFKLIPPAVRINICGFIIEDVNRKTNNSDRLKPEENKVSTIGIVPNVHRGDSIPIRVTTAYEIIEGNLFTFVIKVCHLKNFKASDIQEPITIYGIKPIKM